MKKNMLAITGSFMPHNDTVTQITYKHLCNLDYNIDVVSLKAPKDKSMEEILKNDNRSKKFNVCYIDEDLNSVYFKKGNFNIIKIFKIFKKFYKKCINVAKSKKYSVLYSSSMPNFTHYAAYLVKKKFGNEIKWYASFSDPIKNNPYIEDMKNNKLFSKNRILYFIQKNFYYKKKYQDLALKYADKLIFINEELRDFFIEGNEDLLKKSIIVPLNYVEEWDVYNDLIKYTPKFNNNSKINFIHFGNIYGLRKIDYFLEALLELRNEMPNLEEKIQFIQYGEVEKNQLEKIKCYKLGELVKINNKINYNDCIQKMKYEADVLVVFDTILDEGKIQPFLPSKILDYLLIRKPIFSITTRKSPLYSLINQKHICVTYDVKQIKKGIIKQINNIKAIENNYEMYENKKIIEETLKKYL